MYKGFKNSLADTSLFVFVNKELTVYTLVCVDDILLTTIDSRFIQNLVVDLNMSSTLKELGQLQTLVALNHGLVFRPASLMGIEGYPDVD